MLYNIRIAMSRSIRLKKIGNTFHNNAPTTVQIFLVAYVGWLIMIKQREKAVISIQCDFYHVKPTKCIYHKPYARYVMTSHVGRKCIHSKQNIGRCWSELVKWVLRMSKGPWRCMTCLRITINPVLHEGWVPESGVICPQLYAVLSTKGVNFLKL